MSTTGSVPTLSVHDISAIGGTPYALWSYQVSGLGLAPAIALTPAAVTSIRIAIELSSSISIQSPQAYPQFGGLLFAGVDVPTTGDVQYLFRDIAVIPEDPLVFRFIALATQNSFSPARLLTRPAAGTPWTPLAFSALRDGGVALQQIITAPRSGAGPSGPVTAAAPLDNSTRSVLKATHVPLANPQLTGLTARAKYSFVRQLALQPGEVEPAIHALSNARVDSSVAYDLGILGDRLRPFERTNFPSAPPAVSSLYEVPAKLLQSFGEAIAHLRATAVEKLAVNAAASGSVQTAGQQLQAANAANQWLAANRTVLPAPIGMLNLERIEMVPAGIERGGLIATIPLAPGEKTAVVQKEWSNTTKEFTSIVTDSLENYSETGVTDNTELSQSTTSQIQHGNQFNITGTVSGGIPLITGSASSSFAAQDSASQSATDSRKHASTVTQKASSRTKQEHKVTISTSTVTGTSESTTRELVNSSITDPIRIDYFSLMRKWRVRLYRYGLRLTYDIVVPEPGGALRKAYADLADYQSQIGPFKFSETHGSITEQNYQQLADKYAAQVPLPPKAVPPFAWVGQPISYNIDPKTDGSWRFTSIDFDVPAGCEVSNVYYDGYVGALGIQGRNLTVVGFGDIPIPANDGHDPLDMGSFLVGATGHQVVTVRLVHVDIADAEFKVSFRPTQQALDQWASDVWNALFNAAQTQYYAQQQDIAAKIAALETKLGNVDTLTLRREESDELMRLAIRFLLGTDFQFMDDVVEVAVRGADPSSTWDAQHGVAFTKSKANIFALQLYAISVYENGDPAISDPGAVKFINQAIEWENVVSFLYSYFWDMPESWDFIRQIQHPDATRQAFLRAGSARIVLTIRKGWEDAWTRFVDGIPSNQTSPRLTVAQEIAAYDDRNYPGIPPANSSGSAVRLEDAVYTTSTTQLPGSGATLPLKNVEIIVDSSVGFVVGARVRIDSGVPRDPVDTYGWWEETTVSAIRDAQHFTLAEIQYAHGGNGNSYVVLQPGEKGVLIAEWNEYTPTSGTDIAVTSNLATIA